MIDAAQVFDFSVKWFAVLGLLFLCVGAIQSAGNPKGWRHLKREGSLDAFLAVVFALLAVAIATQWDVLP